MHYRSLSIIYSRIDIWSGQPMLWHGSRRLITGPPDPRGQNCSAWPRAQLTSLLTAIYHGWHKSLLVIFSWRNLNPRINYDPVKTVYSVLFILEEVYAIIY